MTIIGTDPQGNVYAIEHGATRSTLYRAKGARRGLAGLDEIDWKAIFTGISPIVAGIGAKIAGRNQQQVVPVNPYPTPVVATVGVGGLSTTTMMMIGGGALALILLLKR